MTIDLNRELRRVRSDYVRDDYADRVKSLLADRIIALDPDVLIERTPYFNHSAIPDFFLTWPREKKARGVYLRGSYASIVASGDVTNETGIDPIFLALDASKDFDLRDRRTSREMISSVAQQEEHTMLTDVEAVAAVGASQAAPVTPLGRLVRSNFVRGGKGLIDETRVNSLASADSGDGHGSLTELIRESFFEDAAFRMERTAVIMDLATDPRGLAEERPWDARVGGLLSRAEIRAVIPWLLTDPRATTSPAFWRELARRLDFASLEGEIDVLRDLDLTRLFENNLDQLNAGRVYAGLYPEGNESDSAVKWRVVGSTIARCVGTAALRFTALGTKLKATGNHSAPDWKNVAPALEDRRLASVSLHGITRSVSIGAEQSDDIRGDVERIVSSLDDVYHVSDVALRFDENYPEPHKVTVNVDFRSRLAIAVHPSAAALASLIDAVGTVALEGRVAAVDADTE